MKLQCLLGIHNWQYFSDTKRIQRILLDKGYEATLSDCERLWQLYSESMAAGWMGLPSKDDEVFRCIEEYFS